MNRGLNIYAGVTYNHNYTKCYSMFSPSIFQPILGDFKEVTSTLLCFIPARLTELLNFL